MSVSTAARRAWRRALVAGPLLLLFAFLPSVTYVGHWYELVGHGSAASEAAEHAQHESHCHVAASACADQPVPVGGRLLPLAVELMEPRLLAVLMHEAEQRLEEVRSAEWTSVDPVKDEARVGNPSPDFPSENYGTIAGYGTFRRAVTITAAPGNPNLRQVTVSVFYFPLTGGGGAAPTEQNVTLTTLIALRQ